MTNRVLLDSSGLKVSKPGVNVLTASASQLNFNSEWSQVGLYRRGTYTIDWPISASGIFINLGKTFTTPPIVIFEIKDGSVYRTIGGPSGFYYQVLSGGGDGTGYHWLLARVTTTQIRIDGNWNKYGVSGEPEPPHYVIRYSICEYNL
jgi:hypothetical protein